MSFSWWRYSSVKERALTGSSHNSIQTQATVTMAPNGTVTTVFREKPACAFAPSQLVAISLLLSHTATDSEIETSQWLCFSPKVGRNFFVGSCCSPQMGVAVAQLVSLHEFTERLGAPHGRTRSDAVNFRVSTFIRMATRVGGPLSDQRGTGLYARQC